MKNLKRFTILAIATIAVALNACTPPSDAETEGVVLTPDKTRVTAEKGETVTFTVTSDGKDVTAEAKIMDVTDPDNVKQLEGNTFSTYIPGTYTFTASYNYITSKPTSVNVVNQSGGTSNFYRRVGIIYFTGTWCSACPSMHKALQVVKTEYPDRIIAMAVHGQDEFTLEESAILDRTFSISAYPSAVVDYHREAFPSNTIYIGNSVKKSLTEFPAVSGIKIDTKIENGKLTVDAEISIAETNKWRILVSVLEDGILGTQAGASGATGSYTFSETVRAWLTGPLGDELGECGSGQKVQKQYTYDMKNIKKAENARVVVAAMNAQNDNLYYINNIAECPAGGSVDYRYDSAE